MKRKFSNSQGQIFYGMHMYPGVCEYNDPNIGNFRVFLNENTIREMDQTFPGKPIYVDHVPSVPDDIDDMKAESDGYVVESFFNAADGKHWAKFVLVSSKALSAVQQGYRLSNTYVAEAYDKGGRWNHVPYQKQVTKATYEHLALVKSPRYDESVVLTPEEFKAYNERHESDLKRYANEKEKDDEMKFDWFEKKKMSNGVEFEKMSVVLPKSGKEYSITRLVNAMDEVEMSSRETPSVDMSARLEVGESEMSIEELKAAYLSLVEKIKTIESEVDEDMDDDYEDDDESFDNEDDSDDDDDSEEFENKKKKMKNKADDVDLSKKGKKEEPKKDKKQNSLTTSERHALERADRLRSAKREHRMENSSVSTIETKADQVARGKARYGK